MSGVATFEGNIHGDINIRQENANSSVEVGGRLSGLDEGQYILLLVSLSYGGCQDVANTGVRRGELDHWDQGPGETAEIGTGNRGPVAGEAGLVRRQVELMRDDVAGLVVRSCEVGSGGINCDQGATQACAPIIWRQPGRGTGLSWQMLIIIAVAVLIFFIVLITIPLICCCVKRYSIRPLMKPFLTEP